MNLNYNGTPFEDSLIASTNKLINQPSDQTNEIHFEEQHVLMGGKRKSAPKKKTRATTLKKKTRATTLKKKTGATTLKKKPVKQIDTYSKPQLVKIAKKHSISLKTREKTVKTKEQLFRSLKTKKLL